MCNSNTPIKEYAIKKKFAKKNVKINIFHFSYFKKLHFQLNGHLGQRKIDPDSNCQQSKHLKVDGRVFNFSTRSFQIAA